MKRKILFRHKDEDGCLIADNLHVAKSVDAESLEQWTGLVDKNGVKIFEGDIVKGLFRFELQIECTVIFQEGAFGVLETCWNGYERFTPFAGCSGVTWEVVGNIHNSPATIYAHGCQ